MTITEQRRTTGPRRDILWRAALIHRISGLLLACFLPLHFLALGTAIESEARLEGFLRWTDQPAVKLAEAGLVFLLAVHMLGGIRLLCLEAYGLKPGQQRLATLILIAAGVLAGLFLARML